MLSSKVLLLNQNYEPMSVVTAQKAIILFYLQKVEIVDKKDRMIRSQNFAIPLPCIIRLLCYVHIPRKRVELSRRNILRRDSFKCQYCGTRKLHLTVDHVIPKRQNGLDTWENLVCACVKCNNKKGSKTPEQAHMKLLKKPRRPHYLFFMQYLIGVSEESWKPYLYLK